MSHDNLLGGPAPTLLPEIGPDSDARAALGTGDGRAAATAAPSASLPWAVLAEGSLADDPVTAYAFARTGYHRGLDQLRRNGWKGFGPVPWDHVPNQGFMRSVAALARAAGAIGELDEAERVELFLAQLDPEGPPPQ